MLTAVLLTASTALSMPADASQRLYFGELAVRRVAGIVVTRDGYRFPYATVGVHTLAERRLLKQTKTNERGEFVIEGIPEGGYRLLADYIETCLTGRDFRIVGWPRGGFPASRQLKVVLFDFDSHGGCGEIKYR